MNVHLTRMSSFSDHDGRKEWSADVTFTVAEGEDFPVEVRQAIARLREAALA